MHRIRSKHELVLLSLHHCGAKFIRVVKTRYVLIELHSQKGFMFNVGSYDNLKQMIDCILQIFVVNKINVHTKSTVNVSVYIIILTYGR